MKRHHWSVTWWVNSHVALGLLGVCVCEWPDEDKPTSKKGIALAWWLVTSVLSRRIYPENQQSTRFFSFQNIIICLKHLRKIIDRNGCQIVYCLNPCGPCILNGSLLPCTFPGETGLFANFYQNSSSSFFFFVFFLWKKNLLGGFPSYRILS